MRRRTRLSIRRKMSGTLACLLTAISVLSTSSTVPAMAADSKVKMSYKQEKVEKIGIYVEAENESFSAGSNVMLNVYIQNNSGEPLTDGTLKWFDKKETLAQAGFVYDSEYNAVNAEEATPDSLDEGAADLTAAEAEPVPAEAMPIESAAAETEAAPVESVTAEAEAAPVENAPAETKAEPAGPSEETDAAAKEGPAGPASGNGEFGSSWEDDWSDEYDADEGIEEPYLDSEGNLCNIDLAPGEIFEVQFSGTIDSDIYGLKNRDLRFAFGARKENGRRLSNNYKFQFNTGLMTMLPVEFVDGNQVEANEEHSMILHLGLDDIEYMFEEIKHSKPTVAVPSVGTPSEAVPATPSEAENEFTPAEVIKPEIETQATLATPSEAESEENAAADETELAEEEMEEDIEETTAAIEATPSEATPSEAVKTEDKSDEDDDFDDDEDSEGVFNPEDVKYSIETYGVRLKGVKARFDVDASGPAESVTEVSYRVASGTEPGLYFGKVTASVKFNGNTYKTSQGFAINVTGEGEMALRGKLGGAEIIVSGEPSSFGAEDYEILSLQVTEVPVEKEEMISKALEKKSEETGVAVEKMKAMDIKVIADGEVRELCGPVTVTFAGLELDEVKQTADEPEEEKSLVEQAAALVGLDGTEEADETTSETATEVWHLDEDAVEMTDMDSYVNDDGDVVMETDHFSIFVVVNTGAVGGPIDVTIEHWAKVKTIAPWQDSNGNAKLFYQSVYSKNTDPTKISLDTGTDSSSRRYGYHTLDNVYDYKKEQVRTYQTSTTKIYSPDSITIPNQKEYENVEELSKICLATADKEYVNKNYRVDEIWVTNDTANSNKDAWGTYTKYIITRNSSGAITKVTKKTNTGSGEISQDLGNGNVKITLTQNSLIRFVYSEKDAGLVYENVTFYDHNLTDGNATEGKEQGLNTSSNFSSGNAKMGVGQNASGNKSSWAGKKSTWTGGKGALNAGNGYKDVNGVTADANIFGANNEQHGKYPVIVQGEVKGTLDGNYNLQFAGGISQPGFFTDGKKGLKKFTNYELGFQKSGDTYILSTVRRNSKDTVLTGLHEIKYSAHSDKSNTNIYSNEFWPLDKEVYNASTYPSADLQRANASDDGSTHNWHFGMRYDFQFTLGDYTGPMNYYFRGDDDFWLFVDGKLAIDLGGIHSAVGQAIDLRDWLEKDEGTKALDKDKVHRITIYYMERGGFGSSCYMQYTLPNVNVIEEPTVPVTNVSVNKQWFDGNNTNSKRPDTIEVQLVRKVNDGSETIIDTQILSDVKNNWRYTWTALPTENVNNSAQKYTYSVKEKTVPGGYKSETTNSGNNWTITNTLLTEVKVEKRWEDSNNEYNTRPDSITVQLKQGSSNYGDPVVLNASNQWKKTWSSLPMYADKTTAYNYTVVEIGRSVPSWYTSSTSGSQAAGYVITNTYNPQYVTRTVKKIWDDQNDRFGLQPDRLKFQLKQGNSNYKEITLPYNNQWEYTWENLPKYYYTKTGGTVEQHEYTYTVEETAFTNDDYYTPSHTVDGTVTTFTNSLRTAKFRVAKRIDNFVEAQNVIKTKNLGADEFIVTVEQQSGDFSTGLYLKHAGNADNALDADKISSYIEVPVTDNGVTFAIDEIVPKEYVKASTFLTMVSGAAGKAVLENGTVKVYEGADDVVVIVHNDFTHDDYFHADEGVDNVFDKTEIPKKYKTVQVNLAALIPEKKDKEQFM